MAAFSLVHDRNIRAHDAAIRPTWQRHAAEALGGERAEPDAGHSPMVTHPRELADLLEPYAAS